MTAPSSGSPALRAELVAAYNALVQQVTPVGVRLTSARMEALATPAGSPEATVIEAAPRLEARQGGFTAIQPFRLDGHGNGAATLVLELELAVDYDSQLQMTEELFTVFGQRNLPVNARPFLREVVANLTARAGWPPLILPAFVKQGRAEAAPGPETTPPPTGS